jgi:hypothetical protein
MSWVKTVQICCDYPGCPNVPDDGTLATVTEARKSARAEGWKIGQRYLYGRRIEYDLCPDHADVSITQICKDLLQTAR